MCYSQTRSYEYSKLTDKKRRNYARNIITVRNSTQIKVEFRPHHFDRVPLYDPSCLLIRKDGEREEGERGGRERGERESKRCRLTRRRRRRRLGEKNLHKQNWPLWGVLGCTSYRVFVKSACTFHKKSNSGKIEIGGKFEFARNLQSILLNFPHTLKNPPSHDGAKVHADFMNTLYTG